MAPWGFRYGADHLPMRTLSDHRSILVDVCFSGFLRGQVQAIKNRQGRPFRHKAVTRYAEKLEQHFLTHNLPTRLQRLDQIPQQAWIKTHTEELESIYQQIGTGITAATNHAQRKPRPPWSPTVASANARLQFWQLELAHHVHGRNVHQRQQVLILLMLPSDRPEGTAFDLPTTKTQLR